MSPTDKGSDRDEYLDLIEPNADHELAAPIDVRVVEQPISDRRPRRIVGGVGVCPPLVGGVAQPFQLVPEQASRVRLQVRTAAAGVRSVAIGGAPEEPRYDAAGNVVTSGFELLPAGTQPVIISGWGNVYAAGQAGDRVFWLAEFVD